MAVLKQELPLDDTSGVVLGTAGLGSGIGGAVVDAVSEVGTGVGLNLTDGKVCVVIEAAGVADGAAPIVLVRNNTVTTTPLTTRRANKLFLIQRARNKGRSCDSFPSLVSG